MDVLNEIYEENQKKLNNSINNNIDDDDNEDDEKDTNDKLNEIIISISNISKENNIDQLKKFIEKKDKESFFKKLFEMISLPDGDLHESYNEISWELVHSLVQCLNENSIDWDIKNHTIINSICKIILNIIDWISNNCSAREFLLIIQEFDGSSFISLTLFTRISMIKFTKNALKRIPTEKRFTFLKSILPPLLKILIEEKNENDEQINNNNNQLINPDDDGEEEEEDNDDEEEDDDDEKQPVKIIGAGGEQQLQQKNNDNDNKWQYPLSCILEFIYSFALDLKAQDTSNDDPNSGITTPRAMNKDPNNNNKESTKPNTPIAQQQHLFLNYLIKILSLESITNPPQSLLCNGMPLLGIVGECFSLIGASSSYILGTDQRFRLKKREIELEDMYFEEGLDEEDFQDDQDLNLNDPNRQKKKKNNNQKKQQKPQTENSDDSDYDSDYDDSDYDSDHSDEGSFQKGEEDDEYNSIDKIFDLDLSYTGIGHLLYLLVLKPTEQFRLPSPQSIHSILMDNLPYLINLLQHKSYKIGFKTIQVLSFLQKRLKLESIFIQEDFCKNPIIEDSIQELMMKANENHGGNLKSAIDQARIEKEKRNKWIHDQSTNNIERNYHFIQLIECIIAFLVRCPVQQMRNFGYKVLVGLIGTNLKASTKFNLLSTLIGTCIFPSFSGLLIHIFKEEINKCWNSSNPEQTSYFVSPKILEVVTIPIQTGGNLIDRMDSIMNGLNMYRYLLIRDKGTNYTGIWNKSKIVGSRESAFFPLRKDLIEIQSQFKAASLGDEKAIEKVLKGVSKMGVENLSKDEIQNSSTLVCFHIDMALDVISRILELQDTLKVDD